MMTRRLCEVAFVACWITAMIAPACRATGAEELRPNILFAIADDASYPHMGAYGCEWVRTPAFDQHDEDDDDHPGFMASWEDTSDEFVRKVVPPHQRRSGGRRIWLEGVDTIPEESFQELLASHVKPVFSPREKKLYNYFVEFLKCMKMTTIADLMG